MDKRPINPTPWLLEFGINHGIEVTGAPRVLYLSGQTSSAADGNPKHKGNLPEQFKCAWENLVEALKEGFRVPDRGSVNPSPLGDR